ncbi:polymeric immunoglobulin receptor-like [Hoplias malabaricus]|uniref:polymeric immunoglobulin receptor-like n=1 Tax=Hoplias malabaricus TaxID=27720 RepID=UPI003462EF80
MFTVELNSLRNSDSGDYWCAVEIKGGSDDSDYLSLTVSADPAVSVINSRVSGQEGGSVSVQCLYRTDYKNKQKQWCRFRDWSCLTSQNSSVQISDDGRGAVSVEMSGLKKSDAGWYWFSAGEVGVTVHLTVTERPTTTTAVTTISSTVKTSISETTSGVTTTKNGPPTTANYYDKKIRDYTSVKTLRNVAVKRGGSLTIPCFYNEQYKSNPKFWCKGYYWSSCGIVARTNTRGRASVTDYPTQNMFTVELNSLQDSDSGYYWCAVEIGDKWTVDDSDYLYLTVSADPAVSVINSRVSGQEGGSVSVQCLYRTVYKNKQKQWCRFRDSRCLTSQNSAVQISDYGRGAVRVEMSGLKKSDAGWYWFSAGEVAVTVHLTVTERHTTVTTMSSTEKTSDSETTSESESVKTLRNVAVKSGGSLTIPCFYNEQYKSNPKFWCKGYYWSSCGIVARTNTSGSTSVTDYPTQNMFTVELNSLQESDSGYYWCAVEIGGDETLDDRDYLYLTVSADPAVSVINSRVSGQEGGSVSVQCLYRTDYKNKQKQWCRFRDWSCLTSQNSAVQISDDGRGAVSVEMSGLKKSDAGWYWFSAGEVGVTVHLTVTERPTTTKAVTTTSSTEKTSISETTSGMTRNHV